MSGKVLSHLFKPGNTSRFTSKERTDLTTTSGLLFLFEIKKSLSYWKTHLLATPPPPSYVPPCLSPGIKIEHQKNQNRNKKNQNQKTKFYFG
jgi:hypothetical protein